MSGKANQCQSSLGAAVNLGGPEAWSHDPGMQNFPPDFFSAVIAAAPQEWTETTHRKYALRSGFIIVQFLP